MSLVTTDRVKQTCTVLGFDDITLTNELTGYKSFSSVMSIGDNCYYSITNSDTGEWEIGVGTLTSADTLSRSIVNTSSNDNLKVFFSAGNKSVGLAFTAGQLAQYALNSSLSSYALSTDLAPYALTSSLSSYSLVANSVSAFNNRTGNVTLTANDITTLVNANYIQIWKDTQTTAGSLANFTKFGSITSSSGPILGYSRGILTSNTSGTVTRQIFDGNIYGNPSAAQQAQYKVIAFSANDTGAANNVKSGRVMVGQYGEVMIESVTKTNANTITSAVFEAIGGQRLQGTTQLFDPHIPRGMRGKFTIGATGSYNPSTYEDVPEQGFYRSAEFTLNQLSNSSVSYANGTLIGLPSQFQLVAQSTWNATDSNLSFSHAYNYRTSLALGESAELVFQNSNRSLLRTPNMTEYSILTQGYADTRYVLFNNNISQSVTGNGTFGITSTLGNDAVSASWDYSQGLQFSYNDALYLSTLSMYSNSTSIVVENGNTGQNINVSLTSTSAELFCNGNYTQTGDSLLTRSMMDARYQQTPNTTFTGNFTSQDGKVVSVVNGIIISVV